ncbi:WD repeat-containing protein 35 [Phlyctochytrium planicorne]|nr:WD repeat-containing protein 35 [Phlyctochytrium planicorne]
MFVFLSKKIAIPNGVKLRTVAWNNDQGWIACGGEEGLLKVLKLEASPAVVAPPNSSNDQSTTNRRPGEAIAVSSNLSMNQTLEGHSGAVVVSKWNEQYRKLTTSDQYGLIIVWILYKGIWYEEMINNRNKSVVADMQWSKDGQKICIVYEDGAVIVGSVDGNRLWGKELKQTQLAHVQWSPDGKYILFGTMSGELHLYDNGGNFISKVPTFGNDNASPIKIAAIDWYNGSYGYIEARVPCLALAFENGKLQIMRDEKDTSPLIIDSNMKYLKLKWNTNGSILAVSGVQFARSSQGEEKEVSVVQFYDPCGQYLRSLKVPGKRISSLSWEHGGLRIALAVDSFIYFANIRPNYKWAYFAEDVLVYGHNRFDRPETALIFWNTKTNERHTKWPNLLLESTDHTLHRERSFHIDDILDNNIHDGGSTTDLRKKNRLALLDTSGMLKLLDITYTPPVPGQKSDFSENGKLLEFERKDVWDIKWSNDNPELFAIMEKTRMYVFRNVDPEEPLTCSGYLCSFDNLQIKAALLDEIFKEPESPSKEHILQIDSKTLRDTRNILSQVGLSDGLQFVEDNPHPRLWRLVADAALETLNFQVAQRAYTRCADYAGLQFVKRLLKLEDAQKQKAEIAAHFGQYDVAERLYLEMDRKDLAMELRIRLGDWFRVVQLIKSGGSGDDVLLENAWNCIGDYYFDRQKWIQAITYYAQGRNTEKLIECYYIVEDFDSLEKIMFTVPESNPLLMNIAKKFVSVGLCDQAVTAFLKTGEVKAAIDTCVQLNKWNMAVELAEAHKFQGIETLLATYAAHLLEKKKWMSAVELYRKANYCQKSARIIYNLAEDMAKTGKSPLKIKKFYILAALEVERYHQLNKVQKVGGRQEISPLEGLLAEDRKNNDDTRFLDNVWRGAEAYHYYLLAQRQFYSGNVSAAMKTVLRIREVNHLVTYDDIMDPKVTNSLLALISFHNSHFHTCSAAFIKLESMAAISDTERDTFESLALNIFTK